MRLPDSAADDDATMNYLSILKITIHHFFFPTLQISSTCWCSSNRIPNRRCKQCRRRCKKTRSSIYEITKNFSQIKKYENVYCFIFNRVYIMYFSFQLSQSVENYFILFYFCEIWCFTIFSCLFLFIYCFFYFCGLYSACFMLVTKFFVCILVVTLFLEVQFLKYKTYLYLV